MGSFGRALAGGIAGMAGAAGEIYDDRIASTEYDRKQAILEKRDKTLASFRHGLNLERDENQAGIAAGNVERLIQRDGCMACGQRNLREQHQRQQQHDPMLPPIAKI